MTSDYKIALPLLGLDTGGADERAALEKGKAALGFVPNLYGAMANLPSMLDTYLDGYARFRASSGLTAAEQEVVFLVVSRFNECRYCTAAHSMVAEKMSKVPPQALAAIRAGGAIEDGRLAALATFTERMLETRGRPSAQEAQAFLDAGYGEKQVLAIVLAIAVKTLSNYTNHLFHTPVDGVFASYA